MDVPLYCELLDFTLSAPVWTALTLICAVVIALVSFSLLSVVSFFETEFFSLSASETAEIKLSEDNSFDRLKTLSEDPLRTLSSVVVIRYFVIGLGILCTSLSVYYGLAFYHLPIWGICLIIFLLLQVLIFISAEFVPSAMAKKENPLLLGRTATVISFLGILLRPLSLLISKSPIIERRLESRTQHSAAIEDISDTLNLSDADSDGEKEILRGIVNFGKISVDEIMQPRVDIVDIDYKSDFSTVLKIIRESEYSRLPVYEDSIDYVKGILYIKDFLQYTDRSTDFQWQSHIREAYFVPENKKIDDLLTEFQQKHIHMAIVVDEFGGTSGIVTMEDIIEVIVGDICDEHDEEEPLIHKIDDNTLLLDGKLLLSDFYREENINKEVFENVEGDADTLAGLILEVKGYIPATGEVIVIDKYRFEIVSADTRRIKEVKLTILS